MARQRSDELPAESIRDDMGNSQIANPTGIAAFEADEEIIAPRVSSPLKDAWRRYSHNWAAMISLVVILILVFMAVFAPFLHTISPFSSNYFNLDQPPSWKHWFGTDGLGRDQWSRMLFGLRVPLEVGVFAALITMGLGAYIGVISGYFGGFVDTILARFTDVMFAFPSFVLALIVVSLYGPALDSLLGTTGRVILLIVVFSIVGWPGLMRFVRSLALSMKEQQFIEAAKTVGTTNWGIVSKHLLPNMWGLILIQASFLVVSFIYTEAILSIFGLGIPSPAPDLGSMLFDGSGRLGINYWEAFFPSVFLVILIVAFTFIGDGVRDAVDPRGQA